MTRRLALRLIPLLILINCHLFSFGQYVAPIEEPNSFQLNISNIRASLASLSSSPGIAKTTLDLPLAENEMHRFEVRPAQLISEKLKSAFPEIQSFRIRSLEEPEVTGRLTLSPKGIEVYILNHGTPILIQPIADDEQNYHFQAATQIHPNMGGCLETLQFAGQAQPNENIETGSSQTQFATISEGATLRTYKLVVVSTEEFYAENGGNTTDVMAAIVASVNAIAAIFEKELPLTFELSDVQIYDASNDPFTPDNNGGNSRTQQAAEVIGSLFNSSDYDFGHVFHTHDALSSIDPADDGWSTGGVAGLGVVCYNYSVGSGGLWKGMGWSGSYSNANSSWYRLAAHEFAHQFGANHTFNGSGSSCEGGNVPSTNAYEIGSGTTIMSYRGICGSSQNISSSGDADNYFHHASLAEMLTFISSEANCNTDSSISNTAPTADANPANGTYVIPKGTPFTLTGSGSDADGDAITYCWEQLDEDGSGTPTHGFIGSTAASSTIAPLFRSFPPTSDPSRTFPALSNILAGTNTGVAFEALPMVSRNLNFALTVRDNNTVANGLASDEVSLAVDANAGPFLMSSHNTTSTLTGGATETITWDVANTNAATINCSQVSILLSLDGGSSFPITLAASTANDGAEDVNIPDYQSSQVRIKIQAVGNIFFDINDADLEISSDCTAQASCISPTTALAFNQGDSGLDLSLDKTIGAATTAHSMVIDGSSAYNVRPIANSFGSSVCATSGSRRNDNFYFTVKASGTYTVSLSSPGFSVMSFFQTSNYDASNPCNATFLGSNGYLNGGVYASSSPLSLELTAGETYLAAVYASSSVYGTNSLSFSGGEIIVLENLDPDFAYTYLAINASTEMVADQDPGADFTSLGAGTYYVHGLAYKNGGTSPPANIDPENLIGQTKSSVFNGTACALLSDNSLSLTVVGSSSCNLSNPSAITTNPSDCGFADGSLSISVSGANGGLEYSIDGGTSFQSSALFSNLDSGNYAIVIRELGDSTCSINTSASLANPSVPTIDQLDGTNPTECGVDDAQLIITASGANNLEYSVDGGNSFQSSNTFTGLGVETYGVVVRPSNYPGCAVSAGIGLSNAPPPTITSIDGNNPTECGLDDGQFVIHASGGSSLEYSIDNGLTFQSSNTFTGLSTETYAIVVRNNGVAGCIATTNVGLASADLPQITSIEGSNPTECGLDDGQFVIHASGGSNLEYSIDNGLTFQSSNTFTGLSTETYAIVVRNNGIASCIATTNVGLATADLPQITNVEGSNPTECGLDDGQFVIHASGGSNLEYSIDNGLTFQTSNTFTGLSTDTYAIVVRNNGIASCIATTNVGLATADLPQITSVEGSNPTECGLDDGQFVIHASGGSNLEYSIDNGLTFQSSNTFTGLSTDTYAIVVRNNGIASCIATTNVGLATADLPQITNLEGSSPTECGIDNGELTITATGGTGLEYSIDNGLSFQDSGIFTGLGGGFYDIVVRNNGIESCSVNTSVGLSSPSIPQIADINGINPTACNIDNGQIVIVASGVLDLEYSIDNGSSFQSSNTFTGLGQGVYSIIVRSAGSTTCSVVDSVELVEPIPTVIASINGTNPSNCGLEDGAIDIQASGDGLLEFSIDNGSSFQEESLFENLSQGTYFIVVRSATLPSCSVQDQITLTSSDLPELDSITVNHPTDCTIDDGQIEIIASISSGTLEYSLDDGQNFQEDPQFQSLLAGEYSIAVRNVGTQCVVYDQIVLARPPSPEITLVSTSDPTDCGASDGQISILTEGDEILEYSINGGEDFYLNNEFEGLSNGMYEIQIREQGKNCISSQNAFLLEPSLPNISQVLVTDPTDCNSRDGQIEIQTSSTLEELEFSINNGNTYSTSNLFDGLAKGTYSLKVRVLNTDNCVDSEFASLQELGICTQCAIAEVNILDVGTCNPSSNNYQLSLEVNHQNPPSSGALIVNGTAFPMESSPQEITLEELVANGELKMIEVYFSEELACGWVDSLAYEAPASCALPCVIKEVEIGEALYCDEIDQSYTQQIMINYQGTNLSGFLLVELDGGGSFIPFEVDGSGSQLVEIEVPLDGEEHDIFVKFSDEPGCTYNVEGLFIAPQGCGCEIVDISLIDGPICNGDGTYDVCLLLEGYGIEFANPQIEINQINYAFTPVKVSNGVQACLSNVIADSGKVLISAAPTESCFFVKEEVYDQPFPCDQAYCRITDLVFVGTQCADSADSYSLELKVEYLNAPETGTLDIDVEGVTYNFDITESPQVLSIEGLKPTGTMVNVEARLSGAPNCKLWKEALYQAPYCGEPCAIDEISVLDVFCSDSEVSASVKLLVEYTNPPQSGDLEVFIQGNWYAFEVVESPQEVIISGLHPNGLATDVYSRFSSNPTCKKIEADLLVMPDCGTDQPCGLYDIQIESIGECREDGTYAVCFDLTGTRLPEELDEFVRVLIDGKMVSVDAYNLGQDRKSALVCVSGISGDGQLQDVFVKLENGCSVLKETLFYAPDCDSDADCDMTRIIAGPSFCLGNSTYRQKLTLYYDDKPSTGEIAVELNGSWSYHPIKSSPQEIEIDSIPADGEPVKVFAKFTSDSTCTKFEEELYIAPANCWTVGVPELEKGMESIFVIPNPNKGRFHVLIEDKLAKEVEVSVLNQFGQVIQELRIPTNMPSAFDLSQLSTGIYMMRVMKNGRPVYRQVQVNR